MYQSKWAPKPEDDEKASSLSAVATPFSPASVPTPTAPPSDPSTTECFAQTAQDDDLFDSYTPIDNSMRVRSEDDLFSEDFTPVQQPIVEQNIPQRGRGRGEASRGRGRTRGRGAPGRGGEASINPRARVAPQIESSQAQGGSEAPEDAPTGPRKDGVASVRGNRQATGGLVKPKLTEEELAEKMARIHVKNASLTAAHARAEADAASFAEREEHAKQQSVQKQREERRDRQQMMGERERNRMRKLKAIEGREWDAEKKEDDFQKGGRFDKKGGFSGDKEDYSEGQEYIYKEPKPASRGARRGGRAGPLQDQRPPKQDDFPALPPTNQFTQPAVATMDRDSREAVRSWADQVESSTS